MSENYLKPKVGAPALERKKKNGQFVNPPSYAETGGLTNPGKLNRGAKSALQLERGGPTARKGKPI